MSTDATDALSVSIDHLQVTECADGLIGRSPDWFGDTLFGGFLVGQTVHAATTDEPAGKLLHSLHGYFLRPAKAGVPVHYALTSVRDGRTFSTRLVEALQEGKPVFHMACSFTAEQDGYEYARTLPADTPRPDDLDSFVALGGWQIAEVGPTEPDDTGFRASTWRGWIRTVAPLPDDPRLHVAMLAYLTDITRTGGRPLHLDGDTRGLVSLDHAVWFHRPARVDEWLFHDVQSLINTRGRGLMRGVVYNLAGEVVASSSQEMAIRVYETVGDRRG